MSWFSRLFKQSDPKVIDDCPVFPQHPYDFRVGYVYRMSKGYHIKHSYYVEIIEVKNNFIVTSIPGLRTLTIKEGENWDYHIGRFHCVGHKTEYGHLLLNQKGLI